MPYTPEQLEKMADDAITWIHHRMRASPCEIFQDALRQAARDARLRQGVKHLLRDNHHFGALELRHRLTALLAETETP